jgi:hypothetical protein
VGAAMCCWLGLQGEHILDLFLVPLSCHTEPAEDLSNT